MLPWVFFKHKPGLMFGTSWRKTYLTVLLISNHQTSRFWPSCHLFHLSALFSVIRGLAIATLPRMFDLWSSGQAVFCGNRVFKLNIEFCCHLCCNISAIFRRDPLPCAAIPFTWFWFSATIPLSWWCIPMICVWHHKPSQLLLWILLIELPFSDMLQLNAHQQSVCPLGKSNKSPILQ